MKRLVGSLALVGLLLGLSVNTADAQIQGSINYPAVAGSGVKFFVDYGRGMNDDALKSNYFGARAELGLSSLSLWAGAGSMKADEGVVGGAIDAQIGYGGGAAYKLIGVPGGLALSLQAGAGYMSLEGVNTLNVPFGLAASVGLPLVKPWAYAYGNWTRLSLSGFDGSTSEVGFGISGGVEVNFMMGLGFYLAGDWKTINFGDTSETAISPASLAAGLSFKVSPPGM